ncbi:glycogen synthase [Sphingobacterium spiritivorum]
MMNVIHLSVECYPVAKVGGLADVVGALPKYQNRLGIHASVVMPWYDKPFILQHSFAVIATGRFTMGSATIPYEIWKEQDQVLGYELYMIRIPGYLDRADVYGYADEGEQFIAFQHAFLDWLVQSDQTPDVVHCHDHHVGLIPFLMQWGNDFERLRKVKTVLTVHNGQYQGWMNWSKGILLPAFDTWKWGLLDWDGLINPLAAAVKCCTAFTTVSEGYLQELYTDANGLQSLFADESGKGYGIVNGIDTEIWDPQTDPAVKVHYQAKNVTSGKRANKEAFCKAYGLDPKVPLLVFIGRFATEKGADLLNEIIVNLFEVKNEKLSIFILGSGDQEIRASLEGLTGHYEGRFAAFFGYDESLAHWVYASADLLLMPSRVEPCGLNQLYSLRYGTVPVVRTIGGLKDTVIDIAAENGYGISFDEATVESAIAGIQRAILFAEDKARFDKNRKKIMSLDFSWDSSAKKYIHLYNQINK